MKQLRSEAPDPFRKEWDFDKVPPEELAVCYRYELGRELVHKWPRLQHLVRAVKERRKLPKGHPKRWRHWNATKLLRKILTRRVGDFPLVLDWFPEAPWQALTSRQRNKLVGMIKESDVCQLPRLHHRRLSISTLRELESAKVDSIEAFAWTHELLSSEEIDQTEYGFFAINWKAFDCEIIDAFKSWLGIQRAERRKRSRGGMKDKLRRLGALRVLDHYPPSNLADYPRASAGSGNIPNWKLKVPAPYRYLPDFYEAAKRATEELNHLRTLGGTKPVKGKSLRSGNLELLQKLIFPNA